MAGLEILRSNKNKPHLEEPRFKSLYVYMFVCMHVLVSVDSSWQGLHKEDIRREVGGKMVMEYTRHICRKRCYLGRNGTNQRRTGSMCWEKEQIQQSTVIRLHENDKIKPISEKKIKYISKYRLKD